MAKYIFLSSLALAILASSTDAQFAYPGPFPALYQTPRLPWTPLPYTRPFISPMAAYGGSPALPSAAASSLVPSTLYPAPIRPRPLSPLSPYSLAPSPYAPAPGAGVPFGSSFAASFPASAYAPAPFSPSSPLAPSPFIPPTSGFSGIRFGPSRPNLQVTKLDDFEANIPTNADGLSDSDLVAEATGKKRYIYGIRGNKYHIGKPWEAFLRR